MCDGTEALLSCCVPNLQLDLFLLARYSLHLEIYPHCRHVATDKGIVTVSEDGGRLPNAGVPDNEHFKHQVEAWVSSGRMIAVLCSRVGLCHYIEQPGNALIQPEKLTGKPLGPQFLFQLH